MNNTYHEKLGEVVIYDILGKVVYHKFIKEAEVQINVQQFPAGLFYISSERYPHAKMLKQ